MITVENEAHAGKFREKNPGLTDNLNIKKAFK